MNRSTCTFYTKIGACRHGDRCLRTHVKPISSNTLLLPNLYSNPKLSSNSDGIEANKSGKPLQPSEKEVQEMFDIFYKDIFVQLARLGELEAVVVCENENDHLNGNVYAKYINRDDAYTACQTLNTLWYGGKPVYAELSPVDSFHDAICRSHETNSCSRGDHCNFMHIRRPGGAVKSSLFRSQEKSVLQRRLEAILAQQKEQKEVEQKEEVGEQAPATEQQVGALFGMA